MKFCPKGSANKNPPLVQKDFLNPLSEPIMSQIIDAYTRQVSNIRRTLVGNKLLITQM